MSSLLLPLLSISPILSPLSSRLSSDEENGENKKTFIYTSLYTLLAISLRYPSLLFVDLYVCACLKRSNRLFFFTRLAADALLALCCINISSRRPGRYIEALRKMASSSLIPISFERSYFFLLFISL